MRWEQIDFQIVWALIALNIFTVELMFTSILLRVLFGAYDALHAETD